MKKRKRSPSRFMSCDYFETFKRNGNCDKGLPYVKCRNNYNCYACEFSELLYKEDIYDPIPFPLGDVSSVVVDNKNSQVFYKKAVLVTSEALERLDKEKLLYYQMFYCDDGPGCIPANPVGDINGYFLSKKSEPVTLRRSDILGIPTFTVCKKYDSNFFTKTCKLCGYLREESDAYDCAELSVQTVSVQTKIKF